MQLEEERRHDRVAMIGRHGNAPALGQPRRIRVEATGGAHVGHAGAMRCTRTVAGIARLRVELAARLAKTRAAAVRP